MDLLEKSFWLAVLCARGGTEYNGKQGLWLRATRILRKSGVSFPWVSCLDYPRAISWDVPNRIVCTRARARGILISLICLSFVVYLFCGRKGCLISATLLPLRVWRSELFSIHLGGEPLLYHGAATSWENRKFHIAIAPERSFVAMAMPLLYVTRYRALYMFFEGSRSLPLSRIKIFENFQKKRSVRVLPSPK